MTLKRWGMDKVVEVELENEVLRNENRELKQRVQKVLLILKKVAKLNKIHLANQIRQTLTDIFN